MGRGQAEPKVRVSGKGEPSRQGCACCMRHVRWLTRRKGIIVQSGAVLTFQRGKKGDTCGQGFCAESCVLLSVLMLWAWLHVASKFVTTFQILEQEKIMLAKGS
eukprot:scaffold9720_cov16-Tisochrysis_lutea.AAC.1